MSHALDNAARIDAIVDAVEVIVADVLGITTDSILEDQESDEVPATRGYVRCEATNIQPMGVCAYQVPLAFTIGFQVPDDGTKKRTQRLGWQMRLVEALTANDAVPGFKLVLPADMSLSVGGDEPHGFLWGGLTLVGATQIVRG